MVMAEVESAPIPADSQPERFDIPAELLAATSTIDLAAQEILLASSRHDIATLRALLRDYSSGTSSAAANVTDGETGYTPLHAAISGMADVSLEHEHAVNGERNDPANRIGDGVDIHVAANAASNAQGGEDDEITRAEKTLKLLLQNGAVWNTLDAQDETPGCLAWRIGQGRLYELLVDAGVRAEVLFQRLDGYEEIVEVEEDDGDLDGAETGFENDEGVTEGDATSDGQKHDSDPAIGADEGAESPGVGNDSHQEGQSHDRNPSADAETEDTQDDNKHFLSRKLTFTSARLVDDQANAVMMEWERLIMSRTVDLLFSNPPSSNNDEFTILNIGHGMGIFDTLVQAHAHRPKNLKHHIVEAHPDVISRMRAPDGFLAKYPDVTLHEGRWQDVVPDLAMQSLEFDTIYFDTYAEPYASFRTFLEEHVITMLNGVGRWSFFHGLGADRRVCYDVYTKVVEMDLFEAGYDVEWTKVPVDERLLQQAGEGVRRKYWDLEEYKLPIITFLG